MDNADIAESQIENAVDDGIENARRNLRNRSEYTGICHFCGAITGGGRRFCDVDCRDAWQHERDLRIMKGVK